MKIVLLPFGLKHSLIDVHPGKDGHIRVVTLRNSTGKIFKKVTAKIRLLPFNETPHEDQIPPLQNQS